MTHIVYSHKPKNRRNKGRKTVYSKARASISVSHLLIVLAVILANVGYYATRGKEGS